MRFQVFRLPLFSILAFLTLGSGVSGQFSRFDFGSFGSVNNCAYGNGPVCATAIAACETGTCRLPERTYGTACVALSFERPIIQQGACLVEDGCSRGHDIDLQTGLCVSRALARRLEVDPESQILQRPECRENYIYSLDEGRCIVDRQVVLQNACELKRYRWANGFCRSKPGTGNGQGQRDQVPLGR